MGNKLAYKLSADNSLYFLISALQKPEPGEVLVRGQEMGQQSETRSFTVPHNPLQIFTTSKTPAGLYARQKWLGESNTPEWQDDFHETVLSLMDGQSDDGSWNQSPIETIRRLFGLHLTLRNRKGEIEKALGWLIKHTLSRNTLNLPDEPIEALAPDAFRELPFAVGGHCHFSLVCATLFLASIFQRSSDSCVMKHYQLLSGWVTDNTWDMNEWSDISNALRSLIVNPDYAEDPATAALVDHMGEIQDPSGRWPDPIPFYQTVNAMAHLRLDSAHRQWIKSLAVLSNTQKEDGTWGDKDLEWNTFLVVHALKNKACL